MLSLQRWHRDLLRRSMEAEGFTVFESEWWHFDYKDWQKYPIGTPVSIQGDGGDGMETWGKPIGSLPIHSRHLTLA